MFQNFRFFVILSCLLLATNASAVETIQELEPGEPVPDGYGVLLVSFSPSEIAILAANVTIKNVETDERRLLLSPYRQTQANPKNSFTHHVLLLPAGHYYVPQVHTDIYTSGDIVIGRKEANFEVLTGHINYVGYWDFGRYNINPDHNIYRKTKITFAKEPLQFLFEKYPELVKQYPVALCDLGKPAKVMGQ